MCTNNLQPRSHTPKTILENKTEWISIDLLGKVFNKFKSKKSPGTDGLKPIVFKHLNSNYLKFLTEYYEAMLHFSFTPTKWKEARLIFIPKPGRISYKTPKA